MSETKTARTYNQDHVPRKYAKGQRRVSVYITLFGGDESLEHFWKNIATAK